MRICARVLIAMMALLAPAAARAQAPADLAGHWEGSIRAPGMEVPVEIDVAKTATGEFVGTFGQPAQHIAGLPLTAFHVNGRLATFQVKGGAPGQRVFRGEIASDGKSIGGDFASSEFGTLPFQVTRAGDARLDPPARIPAISKALEGTWTGTIDVDGGVELILTLANQPGGTAIGTIVNRNEGIEIPIAGIAQTASDVTLAIKAVRSSYSGTLNGDGTELTGIFTQGPGSLPLTFRRAKPPI